MEGFTAVLANSTSRETSYKLRIRNFKIEGSRHGCLWVAIQCFGLGNRTRKAVEEHTLNVALGQRGLDKSNHDVVGNELTTIHEAFRFQAYFGLVLDRRAEHVTGRKMGETTILG